MELNFKEIDENNLDNNNNKKVTFNNYNTYWDPKPEYEKITPIKKGISYDEILNSMNMVLVNGRLHFIPSSKINQNKNQNSTQKLNPNQKLNQKLKPNQNQNQNPNQNQNQNSYIYDKYFKNYKQQEQFQETPTEPLTPEEIKKNIIINRLKQIQERKRIKQIKSKKLLFDTSNINISHQVNNPPPDLNKLFRFSYR